MFLQPHIIRQIRYAAIFILVLPTAAFSTNNFGTESVRGPYVVSFEGAFTSAPPPFTGAALQFRAAQVGHLEFDGAGQAWGEATLVFHHPSLPFGVRSRVALIGNYTVSPDGRLQINIEERALDVNGEPGPAVANTVVYECYIVRHRRSARCVMHSLVSFQQGPAPRVLPVTMSGSLRRQR